MQIVEKIQDNESLVLRLYRLLDARDWRPRGFGLGLLKHAIESLAMPEEAIATMTNGLRVVVRPRREPIIERSLYFRAAYEPNLMWLVEKLLRPGDIFVDIGANIGHFTVTAASLVGEQGLVLACEPVLTTYQRLQKNIALNDLRNVIAENVAIGDADGESEISIPDSIGCGGASLLGTGAGGQREVVSVQRLDGLLRRHSIEHCRMIKIDVEGFEPKVIEGGPEFFGRLGADIICMEYSVIGGPWTPNYAVERLLSYGYGLYRSTEGKGSKTQSKLVPASLSELPEHDNVYFLSGEALSSVRVLDDAA